MGELSRYQQRVIGRYYEQRDAIMLTRLQELATELCLAESAKKRDQLWQRARAAMENLKVKPSLVEHICSTRNPEVLVQNLRDWLRDDEKATPRTAQRRSRTSRGTPSS